MKKVLDERVPQAARAVLSSNVNRFISQTVGASRGRNAIHPAGGAYCPGSVASFGLEGLKFQASGETLLVQCIRVFAARYAAASTCDYPSARKAITGSILVLDRAGMMLAMIATTRSIPAVTASVTPSVGVTS